MGYRMMCALNVFSPGVLYFSPVFRENIPVEDWHSVCHVVGAH